MTKYLQVATTDSEFSEGASPFRRFCRAAGYPKKNGTMRPCTIEKNGSNDILITIPTELEGLITTAFTAGEQAAIVDVKPGGFSQYPNDEISALLLAEEWREMPYYATTGIITWGDSIIAGASTPYDLSEADRFYQQISTSIGDNNIIVRNLGIGGQSITQMAAASDIIRITEFNFPEDCVQAIVISAGTNDIVNDADTPAAVMAELNSMIDVIQAAFPDAYIFVCTQIARLDASTTADLDTLNGLIRSNATAEGYNVIDCGAETEFDTTDWTVVNDATYYQGDKEHPTAAGNAILGALAATRIQEVLP